MPTPTRFTVYGPIEIPTTGTGQSRHVVRYCRAFWKDTEAAPLRNRKGCYAFGIKHGESIKLFYVGLAAKQSFEQECFTQHKVQDHYNPALRKRRNGKPVMFLVVAPNVKPPTSRIDDLESFLIQTAVANNAPLSNKRKRGKRFWSITGVAHSPAGRPSTAAKALKAALGIDA